MMKAPVIRRRGAFLLKTIFRDCALNSGLARFKIENITTAGYNVDNLTSSGIYTISSIYNPTNVPTTGGWHIFVLGNGGWVTQVAFEIGDETNYVYVRTRNNGVYHSWTKL